MLATMVMIVVAIMIAAFEVPSLLRKKFKKDVAVFCLLMSFSTTLVILRVLHVPLPNPMNGLLTFFSPITYWVDQLLR